MLIICVLILVAIMNNWNFEPLLEKVKNIDWAKCCKEARTEIKKKGNTIKREWCEKCIQAWYVLVDPKTPNLDKILIYAAIIYTVSPWSIIPFVKFRLLGLLDEGAAINFVINRLGKNITPAIRLKAKETTEDWFGPEYSVKESEA